MLVCGIDIGSTNLKVGLSDGAGRLLQADIVPTPRTRDAFGPVTDPAQLVQRVEDMILRAWHNLGSRVPIAAIATTGIGEDGVLIDADAHPLDHVIPWFDRRASSDVATLKVDPAILARAGIAMEPTRTGAKWLWLAQQRPDLVAAAQCWVALTDFPLIRWGAAPFISETLAARTACYDPFRREWIDALLAACHAPPVPSACPAGTIAGQMNSARLIASGAVTRDTLLIAGGHDHPIAASAIRRLDGAARIDSLGTASVLYAETTEFSPENPDPMIACSVPVAGGDGVALIGVFEFADALDAVGSPRAVRHFLSMTPLSGQPELPVMAGSRSIRGVIEAASMTARAVLDGFAARGVAPGPIYATGGWSRSQGLLQLRASVMGQPVLTASEPELGLVGAALIAADAAGGGSQFARPSAVFSRLRNGSTPMTGPIRLSLKCCTLPSKTETWLLPRRPKFEEEIIA